MESTNAAIEKTGKIDRINKIDRISKIDAVIDNFSNYLFAAGAYIIVILMLLTVVDVVGRYIFDKPLTPTYEVSGLMLVIIIFLGMGYTQVTKGHIAVDILSSKIPSSFKPVFDSAVNILGVSIAFLISWQGVMQSSAMRINHQVTDILRLPTWPFLYVVAFGSAIFGLVLLRDLYKSVIQIPRKKAWSWIVMGIWMLIIAFIFVFATWGRHSPMHLTPTATGFICIGIFLFFIFAGLPVGVSMGIAGFFGAAYISGINAGLALFKMIPYSQTSTFDMVVLPLFLLMGTIASNTGVSRDLYETAYKWLGRLPGGLAVATVAGCAGFAAVCSSSVATAATMSKVCLPEMKRLNYAAGLSTGSLAAGGTLGILIPPSVGFIAYGIITEQSIGTLFMAGIVPGILLALIFMGIILIMSTHNKTIGPQGPKTSLKEKIISLKGTAPMLILFLLVMGGLYGGVFTPSEGGGIGAFGAVVISLAYRRLSRQNFMNSLRETLRTSCMIMLLFIGAMIFTSLLTVTNLPMKISIFISGLQVPIYLIMVIIVIFYLILGCFIDVLSTLVLTIPIIYPTILALGIDPIMFGVLVVLLAEAGLITPPVGLNVFIISKVTETPLSVIYKGTFPFLLGMIILVGLMIAFPQIVLWLPSMMK